MPKITKPPVRAKRPKTEVQEEFAEIRRETETARESADAKAAEAARLRAAEVRQTVDGTTVEGVVQGISGLGLEISKALADVSAKAGPRSGTAFHRARSRGPGTHGTGTAA